MRYSNITRASFIERHNRFTATVLMEDGSFERVHIKNTGRCEDLLQKGNTVYLTKVKGSKRMTSYDLIAAEKTGSGLFNIDSQATNKAVAEYLEALKPDTIKPEYTYGNSRIDLYIEHSGERILIEVKGCTLERDGIGFFPDAPTARGAKHLKELAGSIKDGYRPCIAFVMQAECMSNVVPNAALDPFFDDAFRDAVSNGVTVLFCSCRVCPDILEVSDIRTSDGISFAKWLND